MVSYDNETLKRINESVNLFEYASQTLEMERKGADYFASCPAHADRTPSLSFSPDKNNYYCFSCGRGGYIINFIMDFEGLSFQDAVEKASELANIDLSKVCKSETVMFLKNLKSCRAKKIVPYEHKIIDSSEFYKYKKYEIPEWEDEGISQEAIDFFEVRVDEIANRIVYPVRNLQKQLINIKGRTRRSNFKELGIAKYMNYYKVGVVDYLQSLDLTLPYVKEKNEIIIFEGLKSVMKAYGWGFKNCASLEKHTFTEEQISLLVKLKVNIVIALDTDVDYKSPDVKCSIDRLKRITNTYIIEDKKRLLGGREAKSSPVDRGESIWRELYENKTKIV